MRRTATPAQPGPITDALQAYADRGVFRGFRAAPAARGRVSYEFKWLTKAPMRAEFSGRTNTLTFPRLLPAIGKAAAADIADVLASRRRRAVPAHKRLDARRARVSGTTRQGAYSLAVVIRGDNHGYAVTTALNVINEMFVMLQERHPEYLIEHFGMSAE